MAKSRKKGTMASQQKLPPNVSEASRIRILESLRQFREGPNKEFKFESGLTNAERALVHQSSRKMGMISKSKGHGTQRCVSVFKVKERRPGVLKEKNDTTFLSFSEETREVLHDLFTRYPPSDREQNENLCHVRGAGKLFKKKDDSFCKPSMSKVEIAKKVEAFVSRMEKNQHLRQIMEDRSKLPITSFKDTITSTIESQQVVLICGETGCGKTTQVPQMLLDYMWTRGTTCKIVCTQPRRISAISVAERISYERGEKVGDNIGYKIRLETKGGKHSSIMFCTNGILLKLLVGDSFTKSEAGAINGSPENNRFHEITHIIMDEIHERDRFSDFMLAILRDMLSSYPNLRLILMSATLDAERFSQYFGGCPIIRVPGFTYPVKTFYLEDILSILKSTGGNHLDSALSSDIGRDSELSEECKASLDEAINLALSSEEFEPILELISSETTSLVLNYQHSVTGATPLMVLAGKGRVGDVYMLLSLGADCGLRSKDGKTALEWAEDENQEEVVKIIKDHVESNLSESAEKQESLEKYLACVNPEHVDIILIDLLLRKICTDSKEGAILVFLPGWQDINKTRERLLASPIFRNKSQFRIICLHSMVASDEQKKVFARPSPGSRKIILSTNIAETSITIDDVVYVIDSGRMKEKSYDPYANVSTLQSSWISKASAKQREGRAGRCQPGICYHLYSKARAASLPEFQVPEIKRMPIEELCLQVKLLDPNCNIKDFLQKMLDPPAFETIRNALNVLYEIGALTLDEQVTELGVKLGSLPVHPSTGKMLLFAILMNCLDPALTLACASEYKDPFILPTVPDERKRAVEAKAELASLCSGFSDHLIVVVAFDYWRRAKYKGQEKEFCSQYFVSSSTMDMLSSLRSQLQIDLIHSGLIAGNVSNCSLNAQDPGILHAVLVAGSYPMVGKLLPPLKNGKNPMVETASGAKVRLHQKSSIFKFPFNESKKSQLVIFDEITRGDAGGTYIKNATVVGPYPLLLLGTEMAVAPAKDSVVEEIDEDSYAPGSDEDGVANHGERIMSSPDNTVSVVIDRWLAFESTALDVAQIYCLRERLNAAILFKVENPKKVLPPFLGASIFAIACILSYDSLSRISESLQAVDSLTSMVMSAGIDNPTSGEYEHSRSSRSQRGKDRANSTPSDFLRSLMTVDPQHNASLHQDRPRRMPGTSNYNLKPQDVSVSTDPDQTNQVQNPSLAVHGSGVRPRVRSSKQKRGSAKRKRDTAPIDNEIK